MPVVTAERGWREVAAAHGTISRPSSASHGAWQQHLLPRVIACHLGFSWALARMIVGLYNAGVPSKQESTDADPRIRPQEPHEKCHRTVSDFLQERHRNPKGRIPTSRWLQLWGFAAEADELARHEKSEAPLPGASEAASPNFSGLIWGAFWEIWLCYGSSLIRTYLCRGGESLER